MPNPDTVRGPGTTFYVQLFDDGTLLGELQVDELSVVVNASVGVVSGHVQDIVVSYVHTKCIKGGNYTNPISLMLLVATL